ncbi:m-AAA protease-interacting protein 1, mitochondrial-like [Ptychodera flava]|uniref:m-AAA protease-interacting protein 1, mitochondrial-like n=1 Tax=Ptychodera flava TaxID=63121 RepID=UPI00396A3CDE
MASTTERFGLMAKYFKKIRYIARPVRVCAQEIERTLTKNGFKNISSHDQRKISHRGILLKPVTELQRIHLFNGCCISTSATGSRFNDLTSYKRHLIGCNCNIRTKDQNNYCFKRLYSNSVGDKPPQPHIKSFFVGVPNPITMLRNALFFMLLRVYFDPECTQENFKEGAKKAFIHVTNQIAEGHLDQLQGLLTNETMDAVKQRYDKLGVNVRRSVAVKEEDILYFFPYQFGIVYDASGGKWVHILMRFWCLSMAEPSDMAPEIKAIKIGRIADDQVKQNGTVIRCTYEFRRDFTPGVEPEWIIGYIQHGSVL